VRELGNLLNLSGGTRKTAENSTNIGTRLHGNDTELILLIDPDEESLGIVVENATTFRPVAVQAARLEETITFLEQKWSSISCFWTSADIPERG
jgi:hypothetical protein